MPKLTNSSGKPKKLAAVHPNVGLETAYRNRLIKLIDEMQKSILYWLGAAYKANPPEMAVDRSPAKELEDAIAALARRWQRQFDEAAPKLAKHFSIAAQNRVDSVLKSILKKGGFSVSFKMTASANDVMQATIGEQVGLIKSIPQQYLADVQGITMRAVQKGGDLGELYKELRERYDITKRRAKLICHDQLNKSTASMTRVRHQELGIKLCVWSHSGGGKHPRPEHVAFSGKTYDITKGAFLEGKWTWPGVEIGCRCVAQPIIPGFDDPD